MTINDHDVRSYGFTAAQYRSLDALLSVLCGAVTGIVLAVVLRNFWALVWSELATSASACVLSYVLHPYSMVKDHRTNVQVGNPQSVLDGEIDVFIEAYLKSKIGEH